MSLRARTIFITGASRGIGHAIAMRAAADGANIVIAAKTTEPHPKLPGTIHTAAADVEAAGGKALAVATDIRDEAQVDAAIAAAVERFGGIDILVNNASAISLTGTLDTPMKRFDLMHQINTRGTFLCTQKAVPHLAKSANPHVLNISPPLALDAQPALVRARTSPTRWRSTACRCACSAWRRSSAPLGIAVNALWPRTAIDTEAIRLIAGQEARDEDAQPADHGRRRPLDPHAAEPQASPAASFWTTKSCASAGVTDFSRYRPPGVAREDLMPDFFL